RASVLWKGEPEGSLEERGPEPQRGARRCPKPALCEQEQECALPGKGSVLFLLLSCPVNQATPFRSLESLTLLSVAPHDCIPSIRKLRQEDQWFEVSLVCVMRCCK
ncbi:hypothetical protein LEMLEM_LOCUS9002, partial [Lemmus lemmus]